MDKISQLSCDVVVVGAGPAGIAAAVTAAGTKANVAVIDDNPQTGGQIWRRGAASSSPANARYWFDLLAESRVQVITGTRVFHACKGALEAETDESLLNIQYGRLILATGARELFLPFPGWTLPNVMGAGGLQALVKSGLPIEGKRVVLAGTGPLLLAVAAYLSEHGANVLRICEQASFAQLARFAAGMITFPQKLREALALRFKSREAKYVTNAWPVAAMGDRALNTVVVSENQRLREVKCDYMGCGYHLVPNTELAQMLGCRLDEGFAAVDEFQETSESNVYCAGEPTGIGGVELALTEGQIAGHAATERKNEAAKLFRQRARYRKLVEAMKVAFRLRPELASLAKSETLLCRCEDVSVGRVKKYNSWKEAKLHTRCGMGPCQGRICGAAANFLFRWDVRALRPPVFPARCASLAAISPLAEVQPHGGSQ